MTAVNLLWGPGTIGGVSTLSSSLAGRALNDADNAVGWVFNLPKDGTITDVGFHIYAVGGTPPAYNVGLTTVSTAGRPTTTAYGGSAITSYTPTSTGWKWVTLSTSATAVAGAFSAVHVYPTASAPSGTNYISVTYGTVATNGGFSVDYTTAWSPSTSAGPFAVKYSDGSIYGLALSSDTVHVLVRSNTTPDEIGCKFTVPTAMTCYGMKFYGYTAAWGSGTTLDIVLYDASSNVLASTSVSDKDYIIDAPVINVFWDAVNLSASTTYRLAVKPTTASGGDIYTPKWSFESTNALAALPCGDAWQWTQRTDAGTWTDTSTAVAPMALWVSDITLSSASAGGAYAYIG